MKQILHYASALAALFLLIASETVAQPGTTRYVFWFIPSKVEYIHGIAFGPMNSFDDPDLDQTINGMSIEMIGSGIFSPIVLLYIGGRARTRDTTRNEVWYSSLIQGTNINGISISLCGPMLTSRVNGISVGGIGSVIGEVNGVMISPLLNMTAQMRGISVGAFNKTWQGSGVAVGFCNIADEFDGVQIGVFNTVYDRFRGLQIGLCNWSPNGGFFPLVNVRL